mmetsp:Transcript_21329/g.44907  ORF Transcript_21329/g.44907 Transcript_21329/m.44907 type:complete len:146 (+) Transcript_21329:782-1219(+)
MQQRKQRERSAAAAANAPVLDPTRCDANGRNIALSSGVTGGVVSRTRRQNKPSPRTNSFGASLLEDYREIADAVFGGHGRNRVFEANKTNRAGNARAAEPTEDSLVRVSRMTPRKHTIWARPPPLVRFSMAACLNYSAWCRRRDK